MPNRPGTESAVIQSDSKTAKQARKRSEIQEINTELLEACKFVMKHVQIDGNHVAIKMLEEAIAKAEGK